MLFKLLNIVTFLFFLCNVDSLVLVSLYSIILETSFFFVYYKIRILSYKWPFITYNILVINPYRYSYLYMHRMEFTTSTFL